jgi:hypothetical protein
MLPARYRDLVFVVIMTVMMGLSISGIMTAWNGWSGRFVAAWLVAFGRTYVIVVPTLVVVLPVAKRLTALLVAGESERAAPPDPE